MPGARASEANGLAAEGSEDSQKQQSGDSKDTLQARHRTTIGGILTKTLLIQKEVRGRKFRDIAVKIQEAVDALTAFQNEEWPPRPFQTPPPEWMNGDANADREHDDEVLKGALDSFAPSQSEEEENCVGEQEKGEATNKDEPTNTTVAEAVDVEEHNDAEPGEDALVSRSIVTKLEMEPSVNKCVPSDEVMHDAVIVVVQAYSMLMSHPSKSTKASEMTLDCTSALITNRYVSGNAGGREEVLNAAPKHNDTSSVGASLLHELVLGIAKCAESSTDAIQTAVIKALLDLMTSPKCGIHEGAMLTAVRSTFHIYLVTKSSPCKKFAEIALLDMLESVFDRMESYDVVNMSKSGCSTPTDTETRPPVALNGEPLQEDNPEGNPAIPPPSFASFASQYHIDSYLLLRALCKLSSKSLSGDEDNNTKESGTFMLSSFYTPGLDPLALNSKILSLELILAVLERAGNVFCTGEKFIYAIQNYLCVSLIKCCMSNHMQVAYLAQKVFLVLVYKFKNHLKSEIEVFVANIFLKVLESPNSSFEQKMLMLQALRSLCSDPAILTQLFLNYDCDPDATNLFNQIAMTLTKLAGKSTRNPSSSITKKELDHDVEISLAGTEVLTSILRAFLKALGLPTGDDDDVDDSTVIRLRKHLQIDTGLVTSPVKSKPSNSSLQSSISDEDLTGASTAQLEVVSVSDAEDATDKIVSSFEQKRTAERNFELGCVKWTLSLKSGLNYFIDNGFVELDALGMAHFFLTNKDKLDKTQIGEFLGREPDAAFVKGGGVDVEKGGKGFYVRVLHHYVDALNFTELAFDTAIRLFLSGFRLPGEAQKIDRIMEKFAERFTRQNLDVFPSADTAFILGFSVIMLNTDLHNPNIKPERRMTLESFIRNNKGISKDGGDLPEEYLSKIFKRIKASPFSLKEDDSARDRAKATKEMFETSLFFEGPAFFGKNAEDRKKEKFKKEREEMMGDSEKLFRRRTGKGKSSNLLLASPQAQLTDSISPAGVVKTMFDVTWGPLIGTLSQVLECSEDERTIAACLNGFVYAVRVTAHSDMTLARDTFMNALAKFTFLGSIKEMKHKNIESIRTLLSIAVIDGEYLGESWGPVLQCISQLARLRLFASGLDTDEEFLKDADAPKVEVSSTADSSSIFRQQTKAEVSRETEESNGRAVLATFSEVLIDKVFSSTVNLSAKSITHFIEQLVGVSAMEIAGDSKRGIAGFGKSQKDASAGKKSVHGEDGPRIFSLQRLVEVADYNMDVRPRLSWAQVWEIMADHLAKMGCHQNSMVSMFAIDALRQLSFKFLEKPELSEFNFQRIFLRPFLQIMENRETKEETRELILRCVDNMIRSMSHNLRSGWKVFFSILTLSAIDRSERINTLGLAILQRLLDEHLHQMCQLSDTSEGETKEADFPTEIDPLNSRNRNANVEDFVGLCRASLSFVHSGESDLPLPIGLSMRALCHTACYADLLADCRVLPPVSGAQSIDPNASGYTYDGLSGAEALEMVLWRPLINGLAEGICTTVSSKAGGVGCLVQRGSVLTLRAIMLRHGHVFSSRQWVVILKQAIIPALQKGAESDSSKVIAIASESPAVTSLDFLSDPLQLPPSLDDEGLILFATESQSDDSSPTRPLGKSELLVEASFADLRHGGDGNLSRAHIYLKKNAENERSNEPFPDSWVATTAPIAMGMLTDIAIENILDLGVDGKEMIWPIIMDHYQMWSIGRPRSKPDPSNERLEVMVSYGIEAYEPWQPCEALVRIACGEIGRYPQRLLDARARLKDDDSIGWAVTICKFFANILSKSVSIEQATSEELIKAKLQAYGIRDEDEVPEDHATMNGNADVEVIVDSPYGKGKLVEKRKDQVTSESGSETSLVIDVIDLDSGANLDRPEHDLIKHSVASEEVKTVVTEPELVACSSTLSRETYWEHFIPALKIRCIVAHCLQQSLLQVLDELIPLVGIEGLNPLLESLNQSRIMSSKAGENSDLAHTFQEAMFSEWGDGVEEVEEALSNTRGFGAVSSRSGSEMFFLTQEAGATKAIFQMLALLYCSDSENADESSWDSTRFAAPLLFERIMEVLSKFLISEQRDGHMIDPNVWRNTSESGGKIAVYCTSFAGVVVDILELMVSLDAKKFELHKKEYFPVLCSLVRVQSIEIRNLVYDILAKQVAPMIDVPM